MINFGVLKTIIRLQSFISTMKTKLFAFLVLMFTCFAVHADFKWNYWLDSKQYNQWTNSPHFVKAQELMSGSDDETPNLVLKELDKELAAHPDNGYALCNKAFVIMAKDFLDLKNNADQENEDSIKIINDRLNETMNKALALMEKGRNLIPEADKENRAASWLWTAMFYKAVDETNKAPFLEALEKSAELYPQDEMYEILMELAWDPEDVSKTEKYARLVLEKNPNNPTALEAMLGICKANQDHESFIKYYNKYIEVKDGEGIDDDIKIAYAVALAATQGQDAAIDYFFNNFGENYDLLEMAMLKINANPETVLMKIGQREFAEEGEPDYWNMIKGNIYTNQLHNYKEALNCYNKIKRKYDASALNSHLAQCYYMTGDIKNAMVHAQALDYITSFDGNLMNMQLNQGMLDPIINNLTTKLDLGDYLETSISDYNLLGECYLFKKDYQQAANILSKALLLNDKHPATLLNYGKALKALGRDSEANQYFEKTFSATYQENTPFEEVIQSQASILLGRTVEGREMLEKLEKNWHEAYEDHEPGYAINSKATCYDIAATYAMLGDYGKIKEWLKNHFEYDSMPYNFGYISLDSRLDNVRDVPEFKQLVEKYYLQWKNNK